jgi:hypothetical protein
MILPLQWGSESNIVTVYFLPRLSVGVQMKKWIFGIVILFGFAGCRAQESRPFPNAPAISVWMAAYSRRLKSMGRLPPGPRDRVRVRV